MMVDWSSVPSGHGSLADVDLSNMHDFSQLTGTISDAQLGGVHTINAIWTHTSRINMNGVTIKFGANDLYYGQIWYNDVTDLIELKSDGATGIRLLVGGNILLSQIDSTVAIYLSNAGVANTIVDSTSGGYFRPATNDRTNCGHPNYKWKVCYVMDMLVDHMPVFNYGTALDVLRSSKNIHHEIRKYSVIDSKSLPSFLKDKHNNIFLEGMIGILWSAVKHLLEEKR